MDKKPKRLTINDLAKQSGVSISTVSRVLNRRGNVSQETRARVEEAIAALNFQPDQNARKLRGISSKLVALIIPDILNVYYTSLSKEIENELKKQGYTMLLGITKDDPDQLKEYLYSFSNIGIDGIIYTPPPSDSASPFVRSLSQLGIPIIEINRRREKDLFDGVEVDNFGAVIQALEHLYSLGHRKISFIVGSQETTTGSQRLEGYQYFLNKKNLPYDPHIVKIGDFSREFGEKATRDLLSASGEVRPTAIFPTSNRLLMGAMCILRDFDVKVPEDFSVIAMDDAEWLEVFEPSITTVDVAIEEMASLTVNLLMSKISDNEKMENPRTYSLSTSLKVRNSCKALITN